MSEVSELIVDRLVDLVETIAHVEVADLLKASGDEVLGIALDRLVDREFASQNGPPGLGGRGCRDEDMLHPIYPVHKFPLVRRARR